MNPIDNRRAFLGMLRFSEGTSNSPTTRDRGYDQIVGRTRFTSYADHPRVRVWIPRIKNWSTAAGGYQLLMRYYDFYRKQLRLTGFGPDVQDAIALQQIDERGALPDIDAGRVAAAIAKCKNIWASLPGAGYGQFEHRYVDLEQAFTREGGQAVELPTLKTSEELHLAFVEAGGVLA
ncbi:glycoside hydrolase family 104 protein [Herbaspirillum seropedicae]|uniref:Bacteriophage endolysin (Muramidase (Phage lambda lysozyme) protein) n=1 Tax=Herbaspirillum seropedicae (strain SmR1) TaxID=757424 RepID=D8J082_HERSS|nr:glycoside hydrolase family 104 protein [Herbaspirillum seropedicae]ADJ62419.1 bacteriophage endolysin (Muramidase (phage lambda lysozyme) protein) [Herbaspirillum seropedicae SmR1]AKN64552.1 lysozyme [Herbaspirillum seropedicae]NQE31028.1 lysozyme [Herbaspirillum seropedicae]UMU20489.1 glycoside hydrolase family 104 protein [Herbaspirillum seropedicae]